MGLSHGIQSPSMSTHGIFLRTVALTSIMKVDNSQMGTNDRRCTDNDGPRTPPNRRDFVRRTTALCAAAFGISMNVSKAEQAQRAVKEGHGLKTRPPKGRMPVVFLPHGGGPWPFTHDPIVGNPEMYARMTKYMTRLNIVPPVKPRAILLISAHWEASVPTVMTAKLPPMLYDYSGFPPETYQVQWPAPGAPALAGDIQSRLQNAGFPHAGNTHRGFDHGAFVPLKLAYPRAEIPTLQLSLVRGLDADTHFRIGQALQPLRDEGVFIVGSGMSYHNMGKLMANFRRPSWEMTRLDDAREFDEWLAESVSMEPSRRRTRLIEWEKAKSARSAHPREEHLIPLHVIAGAAAADTATLPYRDTILGAQVSAVHFG
jgi:aromatic ring-opening dioxygenase catalytic subunit (LigB family)